MKEADTHIDTLRVQVPEEAARRTRLQLSTKLGGADLHPPELAPSQVLLVRELADPEPGRLGVEKSGAGLDRTWERAVRDALTDCLRRAVRPTNGRIPSGAEAVLFQDTAEAWACWGRAQGAGEPSAAGPWWTQSLEASSDAPPSSAGRSPSVAAVWGARPRLVPAMAAHLAAWDAAVAVVRQMTVTEAEDVLEAVCTAFDAPSPQKPEAAADQAGDEDPTPRSASSFSDERSQTDGGPPAATAPDPAPAPPGQVPWSSFVEEVGGARLVNVLAQESPAHQQLLGVALALRDRPVTVRSRSFRSAWEAWRHSVGNAAKPRYGSDEDGGTGPDRPAGDGKVVDEPDEKDRSSRREASSAEEDASTGDDSSVKEDASPVDDLPLNGDRRAREEETAPAGDGEEARWEGAYTATDLGGVLYLVNVLDALDLPAAATTPPVGEHVGAWATLEALARALLGPDDDALRPNDPLWRVLAALDGRRPETPAGQNLDEAEESSEAFRMPPAWLEAPHVDTPVDGQWAVTDGRLRVWTPLGCVADLEARDDPAAQAEAEWSRVPNAGGLCRATSSDAMPIAPEPADCAPALAEWAARAVPYVRHRLAVALGVDDREADWTADLFRADGRLYTT
ncbi:MAG: hypothetical protein ABEL97_05060, partial [Salinibacter sp.]